MAGHEAVGRSREPAIGDQRDVIAEKFFSAPGHLSIEALLALAREDHPRVGYATVYRTLKLLTECGLAAERRFGEGHTMYETAGDTEHHDHLICLECGYVLEFHNEEIEREQERVARSFGFNVIRHKHELYGLCPRARGIKGGSCPGQEAGIRDGDPGRESNHRRESNQRRESSHKE